jgi:tellurite resistance protein
MLAASKPAAPKKAKVGVDAPAMLHAIFEVASADNDLGETEILMIELVSQHILGQRMGSKEIAASFIEYRRNGAAGVFDDTDSKLSPEGAYAALKAAALVALSDGDLQQSERAKLSAIATRFGMTEDRLAACITDARAAYESVVAQAETQGV